MIMGLDMYLTESFYYGGKYPKNLYEEGHSLEIGGAFAERNNLKKEKVCSIRQEVGCWRKANQIHNWFVENIQKGNDDCGDYYVPDEDLKTLLKTCKTVLKALKKGNTDTASELLPPREGFFFGDQEIDEYYKEDIKNTIDILTEALESNSPNGDFYYSSSW